MFMADICYILILFVINVEITVRIYGDKNTNTNIFIITLITNLKD